jgi:RNA polymerase sigma-70 factor (ECF subfamily)
MHQQALRAFLRRLTGSHAEADDLAQATFVFVWEAIGRFDRQHSFRSWLFGVAWRKYRESRRAWLRMATRETHYAEMSESAATPDHGSRLDLSSALAALPAEPRAAMLLCLALDFTHLEAAEALALPLGTVKSHIARGREKLAGLLGDET